MVDAVRFFQDRTCNVTTFKGRVVRNVETGPRHWTKGSLRVEECESRSEQSWRLADAETGLDDVGTGGAPDIGLVRRHLISSWRLASFYRWLLLCFGQHLA